MEGIDELNPILESNVLILIIMEDTHGVGKMLLHKELKIRLNPYYNGRYSWSYLLSKTLATRPFAVLILIIMEDTHGELCKQRKLETFIVLILIIMEDTHGGFTNSFVPRRNSLNPYYNGRYSWSNS